MATARDNENNVRAGLFVVLSVLLGFVVIVVLSGVAERLKPRDAYTVRFDLATGAMGLEPGSLVMVGGRPVGRVTAIRLRTEPDADAPASIDASIAVDRSVRFYAVDGALPRGFLERPLLGAGADINFTSVGDPVAGTRLPVGSVMEGMQAPPSFLAQAGYGDEQAQQLRNIMARADKITEDAEAAISEVRAMVSEANARTPSWFDQFDEIVGKTREFADDLPGLATGARDRLDELGEVFARARAVIDDNRASIDEIVENTRSATAHGDELLANLNDQTRTLLDDMLVDGRAAMADARSAVQRVDELLVEQTPQIRRSMANARLASDQLKLTLAEVRRSPWRLLYRPDTRELEFELLYDSARTYAQAVSDLRAASETLEAVSQRGETEHVRAMLEDLRRSFDVFGDAERRFLDLVIEQDR